MKPCIKEICSVISLISLITALISNYRPKTMSRYHLRKIKANSKLSFGQHNYLEAIGCYHIARSAGGVKLHSTHVHVLGREKLWQNHSTLYLEGKTLANSVQLVVLTMFGFGKSMNNHQICQCFPLPNFLLYSISHPWLRLGLAQ